MVLPPHANPKQYTGVFSHLGREVGLTIKASKHDEGTVVSFVGIEFDTKEMLMRLPIKQLLKVRVLVTHARKLTSLSLHEIQKLRGYLNFVATVTPLGRTFLRHHYNMEVYFPARNPYHRQRLSGYAKKHLVW